MRHSIVLLLLLIAGPALAQEAGVTYDYQQDTDDSVQINNDVLNNQPTEDAGTPESSEPVMPVVAPIAPAPAPSQAPAPTYEKKKFAVLQTLDKLTARTATMTVPVGQATAVGPLFVDIKTCQKTPPTEQPESAAFLQVWEAKPKPKLKRQPKQKGAQTPSQWVFSGWMFASSPSLSAMDHSVYDVWLKDCVNETAASKQK